MPKFEQAAGQYADRLAAYSQEEEQLAVQIAEQQRAETERRMSEAVARSQGDVAGMAAAQSDPSRLRGAAYSQGAISAQGGADAAMLQQMEDQAARERMLGVYGRRGGYGIEGAGIYGDAHTSQAIAEAMSARAKAEREQQRADEVGEAVGNFGTAASFGLAAVSDRSLKTGIKRASPDDEDELASAIGYTYQYKPEAAKTGASAPAGDRYGPMAQDLERTKLGKSLVVNTPGGKVVDTNAAALAGLSIAGRLGSRIGKLEDKLASARKESD